MSEILDQSKADFWREVRPESFITINDTEALMASLGQGVGLRGQECVVRSVYEIRQMDGLCEWLFFKLDNDGTEVYLLVTIVPDAEPDFTIFYEAGGFDSGNRQDILDAEQEYIFEEPEDTDDFEIGSLEYANEFFYDQVPEDGPAVECQFIRKSFSPLQAWASRNPPQGDRLLTTVVQYDTESEGAHSPEALILEMGNPDNDDGGLIQLFFGTSIGSHEMMVIKR